MASLPPAAAVAAAAPSCPPSLGPRSLAWLRRSLRAMDCIAFDVDSTVSAEEGIDVLADFLGKGDKVREYTRQAMNGTGSRAFKLAVTQWSERAGATRSEAQEKESDGSSLALCSVLSIV